jgi:hypothetical protein
MICNHCGREIPKFGTAEFSTEPRCEFMIMCELLRDAHDELTNAGHQELGECECKIAIFLRSLNDGPGEEDGPWAEGWAERSQSDGEVKS